MLKSKFKILNIYTHESFTQVLYARTGLTTQQICCLTHYSITQPTLMDMPLYGFKYNINLNAILN